MTDDEPSSRDFNPTSPSDHFQDVSVEFEIPFAVLPDEHGIRADVFLSRRLGRLSRNRAAEIIKAGGLRKAEGCRIDKPSTRVFAGETIMMRRRKLKERPIDDIDLPVLYEDDHLLAVNKPGGIVVHPTATVYARTVIRVLRARRAHEYLTLAHRIDKETSGILILAKEVGADMKLKDDFANRRVKKAYFAIVVGVPEQDEFIVDAPMRRLPNSVTKVLVEIGGPGAAPAVTEFTVIARGRQAALVEARPLTGRQHQIRVHLRHIGHPIIGDKLYLGDEAFFIRAINEQLDRDTVSGLMGHWRQALHARRLTMTHPITREALTLEAPLPPDMAALAARYGLGEY